MCGDARSCGEAGDVMRTVTHRINAENIRVCGKMAAWRYCDAWDASRFAMGRPHGERNGSRIGVRSRSEAAQGLLA